MTRTRLLDPDSAEAEGAYESKGKLILKVGKLVCLLGALSLLFCI